MSWTLVEDAAALEGALAAIAGHGEIAVDTEFMRRNTFYPQVALLQLCVDDHAYLIDPTRVDAVDAIRALLQDPGCVKVLHSCSEDLEVFRRWLGVMPTPLVDTQRAAALLGEDFGLGYRALVSGLLGIELEKGETRSDWLRRPLTESQCEYAAQDVLHLLPAWHVLRSRAEETGRGGWVLEEGEEARRLLLEREENLYRRVKGASRLSRPQLGVLRGLCNWREERARTLDKPRGWILDDKVCVALAQRQPGSVRELESIDNLPPAVRRKSGDTLVQVIRDNLELSAADQPEAMPQPLPPAQRDTLKALRGRIRERAAELGCAPEILLSGADLELLVREAAGESVSMPARFSGWRAAAAVEPLRAMLADA